MADKPDTLKAARYIGEHSVELSGGPYQNIDGTRKRENVLNYGDTMMMPAEEIYGKTLLHDPHAQKASLYLGLGRVVLPEHVSLSDQDRALLGYEHHLGRGDFLPLEPLVSESATPVEQPEQAFIVPAERVTEVPDKPEEVSQVESDNS